MCELEKVSGLALQNTDLSRKEILKLLDLLSSSVRVSPMDGDNDLCAAGSTCSRSVLNTHRVMASAGQEGYVTLDPEHRG